MAKKNYFKEVSSYQKEHPRATREAAMKAVSAMRKKSNKVSGTVKTKTKRKISGVAGIKKARPVKVAGTKKRRVSGASVGGNLAKGNAIIGKINSLEQQRKKEVGKLKKDLLALEINSQHAKLDKLMRDYKRA